MHRDVKPYNLLLIVVLLAACGCADERAAVLLVEQPSRWVCSCTYTCWEGDDHLTTIPVPWCTTAGRALDAGPLMDEQCRYLADHSGNCDGDGVPAKQIVCDCGCRQISQEACRP